MLHSCMGCTLSLHDLTATNTRLVTVRDTHCSLSWRFSASSLLFSWRRCAHSSGSPSAPAAPPFAGRLLPLLAWDLGLSWPTAGLSVSERCTGSTLLLVGLRCTQT